MDQNASKWKHCLEIGVLSDVGLRRTNNQDSMALALASSQEEWQRRGHLFLVADGMGAHAAGELASKLAADNIPLTYRKIRGMSPTDALQSAITTANENIHQRGQANDDFKGMGTTVSALVLLPQGAVVGQVGDSRTYRLRNHSLEQLTFDHSLVWEMAAAGQIPDKEVESYVPKNIITRSLGPHAEVKVDLEGPFPIETGDTFLLCSDGLSGPVSNDELGTIMGSLGPEEAVRALVDLANLRGGPDNITVIIVRVTGPQVVQEEEGERPYLPQQSRQPVHPLLWSGIGVFLLAALGSTMLGAWVIGGACLLAAAVLGGLALAQSRPSKETDSWNESPLGKGPYSVCSCVANLELAQRLAKMIQELREATAREEWAIDWNRLNELDAQATAALQGDNHAEAIRAYCRAMSFLMDQLRHLRQTGSDDSSVLE